MRNEVHIRLKCLSRLIQRVHLGMKPEICPDSLESMFRTTKRLFVVRLIDRSKGPGTEPLAAYKPQLRRSRPLWEEPLSPSHDVGHD
jgi:hypothetical protein